MTNRANTSVGGAERHTGIPYFEASLPLEQLRTELSNLNVLVNNAGRLHLYDVYPAGKPVKRA